MWYMTHVYMSCVPCIHVYIRACAYAYVWWLPCYIYVMYAHACINVFYMCARVDIYIPCVVHICICVTYLCHVHVCMHMCVLVCMHAVCIFISLYFIYRCIHERERPPALQPPLHTPEVSTVLCQLHVLLHTHLCPLLKWGCVIHSHLQLVLLTDHVKVR